MPKKMSGDTLEVQEGPELYEVHSFRKRKLLMTQNQTALYLKGILS